MDLRLFLGPKIWNILTDRFKNDNNIEAIEMQINKVEA